MTPKEKALELIGKYLEPNGIVFGLDIAKQCVLIAVDEIIKEFGTYYKVNIDDKYVSYWQEVKQEINKL